MRNELLKWSALAVALALAGCVTGGSPAGKGFGDVVVVERSKEHPPAWIGAPTERLSESDSAYRYVEISGRMFDLPLGLKQTQLKAIDGSRRALSAAVREQLMDAGGSRLASKSLSELQRMTDQVLEDVHGRYAKVADIYFEKLEDRNAPAGSPTSEFFAVYVLVHFGKDRASELYQTLGQRLQRSGDPTLKRLAPEVLTLARSPDLSH